MAEKGRAAAFLQKVLLLVAFGAVAYVLAVVTGKRYIEAAQFNRQAEELRTEIAALRSENEKLQAEIQQARTDQAVEQAAREQLNLVRPGDVQVVVVPPPSSAAPQAPTPAPGRSGSGALRTEPPVWQQWLQLIAGRRLR